MGIRVNKMCGYALTDLEPKDERINWDSLAFKYELEGDEAIESYFAHVEAAGSDAAILDKMMFADARRAGKKLPQPQNAIRWGTADGGLERVLCIRPVSCEDWHRNDDIIDWLEEARIYGRLGPEDWVDELPFGIFPWSGSWMDSATGERLDGKAQRWAQIRNSVLDNQGDEPPPDKLILLNALAGELGMTHAEATKRIKPVVPDEVRLLAEWAGLFTGPLVWAQLRPVVYVWWS